MERLLITLSFALLSNALAAAPLTLRTVAQESIPPKWITRGQHMEGVCPDILAALERVEPRLHFTGQDAPLSVPAIEKGLASGQLDVACALLDTPHRRQIAHSVGKPLYSVRHRLAAAAGDPVAIANLDELVKLNPLINTSRGAGYSVQLRARGLQVDDSTGDNMINLKKIIAGHGRFTYMNELTLGWLIASEDMKGKVRILPAVLKEEPMYFWASRKASPDAVKLVEHALEQLEGNGELARIYANWAHLR